MSGEVVKSPSKCLKFNFGQGALPPWSPYRGPKRSPVFYLFVLTLYFQIYGQPCMQLPYDNDQVCPREYNTNSKQKRNKKKNNNHLQTLHKKDCLPRDRIFHWIFNTNGNVHLGKSVNAGFSKWAGTRYFYPSKIVYSTDRN